MSNSICFILFILFSFTTLLAQSASDIKSTIPPEILRQITNGATPSQILKNQQTSELIKSNNKIYPSKSNFNKITEDSISKSDTTLKIEIDKNLSTYEKIFQGQTIHPDSLLPSLSIFGHDLFLNAKPTTFSPTENISVPSTYIVNIDDEIILLLWGRINEENRFKVGRDGTINIPRIGPVNVAGLTFSTMKENILSRVEQIEGVNASVSIGIMRTIGVYIVGEVTAPGFYTISALSSVTNALFFAGGPSKSGSLRNIELLRDGKRITKVDLYEFLLNGKDNSSLRLQSGDVIHIPIIKNMVAVCGNVRRSAFYELNSEKTLKDVLSLAGEIAPAAWANKMQVKRFFENKYQKVLDVDSTTEPIESFSIQDGDIIKIFPILNKFENSISLTGNVLRTGKFQFKDNMKLHDIIPDYKYLLPETYLDYAIIIRQDPPKFINQIITVNLKNAIDSVLSRDNIPLQPRDHIIVYNLDYFEPDRFVTIDGSISNPGTYKLLENMKLRDLILQAGGLSDDASTIRGELYRRQSDKLDDLVATTKIEVCIRCILENDTAYNIPLKRLDRLYIRSKKGWEEEKKISLRGQFQYPGIYVLLEGETLGALIKRAGGFKENAYLDAAVFTRKTVKDLEEQRIAEYRQQMESDIIKMSTEMASKENNFDAKTLLEQQLSLQNNQLSSKTIGRVVVDLTNGSNFSDFTLEDGDELYVPRNLNTISVFGEIFNPSTFKFDKNNKSVAYYIEAAGSYRSSADIGHIYIIRANGMIITNKTIKISKAKLEPGDAVMVPQKIKFSNPHKIFVDTVDAIFKIASVMGTLLLLYTTIYN